MQAVSCSPLPLVRQAGCPAASSAPVANFFPSRGETPTPARLEPRPEPATGGRQEISRAEPVMGMGNAGPDRIEARLTGRSVHRMERRVSFIARGHSNCDRIRAGVAGYLLEGRARVRLFPAGAPLREFRPVRTSRRWSVSWRPTRSLVAALPAAQLRRPPAPLVFPVFSQFRTQRVAQGTFPPGLTRA